MTQLFLKREKPRPHKLPWPRPSFTEIERLVTFYHRCSEMSPTRVPLPGKPGYCSNPVYQRARWDEVVMQHDITFSIKVAAVLLG